MKRLLNIMEKLMRMKKLDPVGFYTSTKNIIEKMTEVTNNHELTPELSLRLVTPTCSLWTENSEKSPFPDPFWAFYWPGGQALTRFILDNRSLIEGKYVLDLGSGCGSLSIAAAKLGNATKITANDIDPVAAVAVELNAHLNDCKLDRINILLDDIIGSSDEHVHNYNCILLGDMFYDEEFKSKLMDWLLTLMKTGVDVFIGDPGRHLDFYNRYSKNVEKVAEYRVSDEFRESNDLSSNNINVWKLYNNC